MPTPPAPPAISDTIAFGASWNRSTRLLTALFLAFAVTSVGLSYSQPGPSFVFLLTAALVGSAVALAYSYAPVGYHVNDTVIAVRRRAGAKEIPFSSLRSARLVESAETAQTTWRWPAVGGLFGFYGTFETPALGRHQWYASRDQDLVLLQTVQGPLVLSPDDSSAFVREVNQRLRASTRI